MGEVALSSAEDYARIRILVQPIGDLDSLVLNRVLQRLSKTEIIDVSENPRRFARAKFITTVDKTCAKFGEFQVFRQVFGLLCIGQKQHKNGDSSVCENHSGSSKTIDSSKSVELIAKQYTELKEEYRNTIVNSQCILFGCENASNHIDFRELLSFPRLDDADELELGVRELIRSIYIVLESRRLNKSFEQMDSPPCPLLPDEEKYKVGTDNVKSRAYRRKCLGRNRKQIADYALLTGLPTLALDAYDSAIECLEQASDFLWLAAALEGWSCAAILIKYKDKIELLQDREKNSMQRSSTASATLNYRNKNSTQHRHRRSDEVGRIISSTPQIDSNSDSAAIRNSESHHKSSNLLVVGEFTKEDCFGQRQNSVSAAALYVEGLSESKTGSAQTGSNEAINLEANKQGQIHYSHSATSLAAVVGADTIENSAQNAATVIKLAAAVKKSPNLAFTHADIVEKFAEALTNYVKFSFASQVECECVVRNVAVFVFQRAYVEAESFIHERMARFLDDKFTLFDNKMKAQICLICAAICNKIGFHRKNAFYLRLSVLFRLNVASESAVTDFSDYKEIYPVLHRSLRGYGLKERYDFIDDGMNDNGSNINIARSPNNIGSDNYTLFSPTPGAVDSVEKSASRHVPFSIQVKAVYEVFISASRAGLYDVAIRHLCYILQNYFDHMATDEVLEKIGELTKLIGSHDHMHSLAQPIYLREYGIVLPPVEFSRFPMISNFQICDLPPHLAPNVLDLADSASKIFIYSPFQDKKGQQAVYWVVDCACEVSIGVCNPLPVELTVKNLCLLVSGCSFEAIPIRLNLPSCYATDFTTVSSSIKLLGVPRSAGTLSLTGYSYEVLGVKSVCSLDHLESFDMCSTKIGSHSTESQRQQSKKFTVRVLDALPLLSLETSLNMTPTTDNIVGHIAEATVFSGQILYHSIFLHNTSPNVGIGSVSIKIHQLEVCGGPKLIDFMEDSEILQISPGQRLEVRIKIFGIDPSATTSHNNNNNNNREYSSGNGTESVAKRSNIPLASSTVSAPGALVGEEHRVYVRRNTSLSIAQSDTSDTASIVSAPQTSYASSKLSPIVKAPSTFQPYQHQHHFASAPKMMLDPSALIMPENDTVAGIIDDSNAGHDLIPYIGRLLSAEFEFTYTAAITNMENERYERVARLPLAIAIVPAVNVADWHILAGDGPTTRYVVLDVTNSADVDAELNYGEGRNMWVQPKEICRVPLLCPCCTEISSNAFTAAMRLPSHMMQMREIERLRKALERHISRYLDIKWNIPALNLNGLVPVGSLLSSVSFLKQLVIPEVSVSIKVNDSNYISEDDVLVGVGELIQFRVTLLVSAKREEPFCGVLSLNCYQDLQNPQLPKLNCQENIIVYGATRVPFCIRASNESSTMEETKLFKDPIEPEFRPKEGQDELNESLSEEVFKTKFNEFSSSAKNESSKNVRQDSFSLNKKEQSRISLSESKKIPPMGCFETTFTFTFRYEGVHKIQPELASPGPDGGVAGSGLMEPAPSSIRRTSLVTAPQISVTDENIFIPFASFNVVTRT